MARDSLVSSILFSNPANILMIVVLNSGSGILLIYVLIRSLAMTSSCSFFWDEFLHLGILPRYLCQESLLCFLLLRVMALLRRGHRLPRAWHFRKDFWCILSAICCCVFTALSLRSVPCRVSPYLQWEISGLVHCVASFNSVCFGQLVKKRWDPISPRAEALQHPMVSGGEGEVVLVFQGRGLLLLWLSGTFALGKNNNTVQGGEAWCMWLKPNCGHCAAHRRPSVLMGGGKNNISQLSCPQRAEFLPATAQQALTKEKTISHLSQASLRSLTSSCLCLSCLPTRWLSASVFYFKHTGWVSKLHILGTHGTKLHWSSGGRSHQAVAGASLSQKGSCTNA